MFDFYLYLFVTFCFEQIITTEQTIITTTTQNYRSQNHSTRNEESEYGNELHWQTNNVDKHSI